MKTSINNVSWILLLLFTSATELHAESSTPEYAAALLWDSKYVSEGRNNLDDGGLLSLELTATWDSVSAGLWLADGTDSGYNELNLFIEYGFSIGTADAYVGYTRLEFPDDDASDHEFSGGISWPVFESSEFAINYVHATESDGGFLDLVLSWEAQQTNEDLAISPYLSQSYDFGYASVQHDGRNNIQIGINTDWSVSENCNIMGTLAHSWAQNDVKRDGLGDETWISLGISNSF